MTLQSSVKKHVPVYKLKVSYEAPSGKNWEDKEIEGRFAQWFSEDGFLQHKLLRRWLASNIDVVGMADPGSKTVESEEVKEDGLLVGEPVQTSKPTGKDSSPKSRKGKKKA